MQLTRLVLANWRNFGQVDVALQPRTFLVGANGCGKSNLLDAIRFLRDLADPRGGLAHAVSSADRGSLAQLRARHAPAKALVSVGVEALLDGDTQPWYYEVRLGEDQHGQATVEGETVRHGDTVLVDRPDAADSADRAQRAQTHLEQVGLNREYRPLAEALARVCYVHLVPQLVRQPDDLVPRHDDPWGRDLVAEMARETPGRLAKRMARLNHALRLAVPQLDGLELVTDDRGQPHLLTRFSHWRQGVALSEQSLSDGTLRLVGLLWALQEGRAPLLLEEPEMSLQTGVIRSLPQILAQATRRGGRQAITSTHSRDMLYDDGIDGSEILVLRPSANGTTVQPAASDPQTLALLRAGVPAADAVVPLTDPDSVHQLYLTEF